VIQATKVVRADEMVHLEQGVNPKILMERAGLEIALVAKQMLEKVGGKKVVLLIGKGNKGGDAYVAGLQLLQWGFQVRACPLFPMTECSELNRFFGSKFAGKVDLDFSQDDLIIDGLLGTGFRGQVEGSLRDAIERVNLAKKPVLAIDIPSGINGNTGRIGGCAIKATATATIGLPKCGLFLNDGWNYTGTLSVEEIGLPTAAANGEFLLPDLKALQLPPMARNQHKYQRGFVLGFGGSSALKGAMKLSCKAAIHAGAGIVKAFSLEEIGEMDDELICQIWESKGWSEALSKAQAVFVGPGLGRNHAVKAWLETNLKTIKQPCVIDADALFFLKDLTHLPKNLILTPHRGEMLHLLGETRLEESELLNRSAAFAEEKKLILVLKGAPTFVFSPGQLPYILDRGDPGMATAGSGDVLTGIIAAQLAQGNAPLEATILGVALHGLSGEAAASEKTSYGYSASDLIGYLPRAFEFFLS